jgi:S-adenosylmethionine-diacylgycerolhomoserine-N-methlytransferase
MMLDQPVGDHAERMDQMYRHQRHIYDLTRKYYLLGRDATIRGLNANPGQSVLELGCGTGRNLRLISRLYPDARLFGLDISEEMLISARNQLPQSAQLIAGDASAFSKTDFKAGGFDHILISYALSMIPNWQETIVCAIAALKPGGILHIVDFGQQERLPAWFRKLLKAWLDRFHVTPRRALATTAGEIAAKHGCTCQFQPLFRGYAWRVTVTKPLSAGES